MIVRIERDDKSSRVLGAKGQLLGSVDQADYLIVEAIDPETDMPYRRCVPVAQATDLAIICAVLDARYV